MMQSIRETHVTQAGFGRRSFLFPLIIPGSMTFSSAVNSGSKNIPGRRTHFLVPQLRL